MIIPEICVISESGTNVCFMSSECIFFLPFNIPPNFLLKVVMVYLVIGTKVISLLV